MKIQKTKRNQLSKKNLKDWLENYFATLFEDVRLERSLKLLLPVKDPDIIKQGLFGDQEYFISKILALE